MALRGKKNHYNVKFLKGYGHSISVKNSKIVLKNNHDPFSQPQIEEWFINNMPYEKIILQGKGYISTEALTLLSQNNRNVILLDTFEKDGRLYYKFNVLRNSRLRSSIIQNKLHNIGEITQITKEINLNVDRKRFWLGKIASINQKESNESVPISLNHFKKGLKNFQIKKLRELLTE